MFLLPSLLVGVVFALVLGGQPARLLDVELRRRWAVPVAAGLQAILASPLSEHLSAAAASAVHIVSYGFLLIFAVANVRTLSLAPLLLGMLLNAIAIVANGGRMPVSPGAWRAAGLEAGPHANVELGGTHLTFLGDVFALPERLPYTNVFSVGDLLIGFGVVAFIVLASSGGSFERELVPSRLLRPLKVGAFRRLVAGKLVSHLGDWLTLAALVGWVYERTASTTQVAILMLVRLAPPILGGGFAAAIVDRLRKERLLVTIEVLRGHAVAAALAAVALSNRPLAFAAVGLSGALAAISAATIPALVPSLLDDEELPAANAGLGIAQDAAMALGALAGGIALTTAGVLSALAADLATFGIAAALYWGIRVRPAHLEADDSERGIVGGLRYLLRQRFLAVVIAAFGAATLATGLVNATLPRFLDEQVRLGSQSYGFGLAALAAGLVVGQAIVGFARLGSGGGRWIGCALVMMAGLFVALALTKHAPTAILFLGLIGLVDGTTDVLFDTVVQREADPRYYGRVFGFASAFMTMTMMGAVGVAPLVNRIAVPREVILTAGLCLLAAATIALVGSPGRRAEPVGLEVARPERTKAAA